MKRISWLVILCCFICIFMVACGNTVSDVPSSTAPEENTAASDPTETSKMGAEGIVYSKKDVEVRVDGFRNEDSHFYIYLTVTNNTAENIVCFVTGGAVNQYMQDTYGSPIKCAANSTQKDTWTVERSDLLYANYLVGLTKIDRVALAVEIYADPDGDGDVNSYREDLIDASDALVEVEIEPLALDEEVEMPTEKNIIFDDGTYAVSLIGLGEDLYGLSNNPILYLLVENHGNKVVFLNYDDPAASSYQEILDSYESGYRKFLEIDGAEVECSVLSSSDDIWPGAKRIITIEMYLEKAGLNLDDIQSIKKAFAIEDAENYPASDPITTFTMDLS